jgi:hypothetical protein
MLKRARSLESIVSDFEKIVVVVPAEVKLRASSVSPLQNRLCRTGKPYAPRKRTNQSKCNHKSVSWGKISTRSG